ncbi:MAG: GWxTD domain-containing protein [Bacteroidales bacterium]|nr:GWxTD domain-containing protein [Bacteroidales bacterium]
MKRLVILLLAIVSICGSSAVAQGNMSAVFSYSTFYSSQQGTPYVETYLSFDAWTVHFAQQDNGAYRATVEVSIIVQQGDSICFFKKYDLNSPSVGSLDELDFNFIDLQRFPLKNGIYDLRLSLRDKGTEDAPAEVEEKLAIYYDNTHPALSSLQMMSAATPTQHENLFSRGGYDMEPYVSDFFPEQVEQLNFYYEIYNIDRELGRKPFLATAYIEQQETGTRYDVAISRLRKYSAAMVPVYASLDIKDLPSGNFNLVVELRNSENQLMLYKKLPFFRSNPGVKDLEMSDFANTFAGVYNDEGQLNVYLDALYPLASKYERQVVDDLIHRQGLEEKQAFLYRFWHERYPLNAETEWLKYKERIDYVQVRFSYPHTPGIHTDCGRVYLKYGPPDFVRDEKNFVSTHAPSGLHQESTDITTRAPDEEERGSGHIYYLPYQLWRYNKLPNDDPDRVFLFWDEQRSGYYKLLTSSARGEVRESGWERRLCRGQLPENTVGEVGQQYNRGY